MCVTGDTDDDQVVDVDAGTGDDTVDTTGTEESVDTALGTGVDTFVGGPGSDDVNAGAGEDDAETISTGGGYDTVVSGRQGHPMNDVIDLGDDVDYALLRGLPGTGSVDGGSGRDYVQLYDRTRATWVIDNRKQTLTADDATMPLVDIDAFNLFALRWESLRFTGGPRNERLDVSKLQNKPDGGVLVDMGGGRDRLTVGPTLSGPYHGGADVDRIIVTNDPRRRADQRQRRGRPAPRRRDHRHRWRVQGDVVRRRLRLRLRPQPDPHRPGSQHDRGLRLPRDGQGGHGQRPRPLRRLAHDVRRTVSRRSR